MLFRKKKRIPEELLMLFYEFDKRENEIIDEVYYYVSFEEETAKEKKGVFKSSHIDEIKEIKLEPTFREVLFRHIDDRNLKDSEVYRKANIDRRLFSKIRCDENYNPSRQIIISLALALKLETKELESLLETMHYSLYNDNYFDITIRYCFDNKIYNYNEVNDILYSCNLKLLSDR